MKIIKVCKKHGNLTENDIIKSGISYGNQRYKCKKCMKDVHHANYKLNKEKIAAKTKKYREENKEKMKEIRREYFHKTKDKNREAKHLYDRKYNKKIVDTLDDRYVRWHIARRSKLKYKDVPQALVDLKKALMLTKRKLKEHKSINIGEKLSEN